ncbi:PIN domain-containing protein [Xanthomonas axonopodis]
MDSIQRYALDTNFFLQVKAAETLPWGDLTRATRVELYLLDEVMGELDRHKSNGNSRAARRARGIFGKLDPLIDGNIDELVVKEGGPQVVWLLAPFFDSNSIKPSGLDLSTADGRIVEQSFALQQALGDVVFLTHDRLPRRIAKSIGLLCEKIPESWLLEPEKDERDKEIAKLKDDLKALNNRFPQVEVQLVQNDKEIDCIEGVFYRYRDLSEEFLDDATDIIENRFPEESAEIPGQVTVTRQSSLLAYQQARREWREGVRERIGKLPARLNFDQGLLALKIAVKNTGGAPADGLTLEVRLEGTMMLVNHKKKEKWLTSEVRFTPPAPPKLERYSGSEWYERQTPPDLSGLHRSFQTPPSPRDPNGFYWDYDEDAIFCKSAEGSCGDFRHQMREVEVPIILFLPQGESEPKGCLRIRWSARNMPKVFEKKYSIKLSVDWYDSEDAVGRLVIGGET